MFDYGGQVNILLSAVALCLGPGHGQVHIVIVIGKACTGMNPEKGELVCDVCFPVEKLQTTGGRTAHYNDWNDWNGVYGMVSNTWKPFV